MTGQLLRARTQGRHAQVTNVELFFDLVFVFAVTQLSHTLLGHLNLQGAIHVGVVMLAVWWAWVYTAWVTNWLDPEHVAVRGMLFVLMAVGLVLSTSVPEAFAARAVPFAVAYVTFQVGRSLFMLWAGRRDEIMRHNFQRITTWLATSGVLWIAGAFSDETLRLPLWATALAIETLGPVSAYWTPWLGRTPTAHWDVEGGHMAERCGLFIIICLGESVLVTGATFAETGWGVASIAAFVASLAGSIAMWWIYFNAHADAAKHAIEHSQDPGRIARHAYTYAHVPIVAGIIVTAAGDELALAHPDGHVTTAMIWLITGGPALFLAGAIWFKRSVFGVLSPSRLTGLALLAAVALAAPYLTPLLLSAAATLALIVVALWETLAQPEAVSRAHPVKA